MPAFTLHVPGMTCRHCVRAVTARLRDLPGVETVEADASRAEVTVVGSVDERRVAEVARAVMAEIGLTAHEDDAS